MGFGPDAIRLQIHKESPLERVEFDPTEAASDPEGWVLWSALTISPSL